MELRRICDWLNGAFFGALAAGAVIIGGYLSQ